MGEHVLRRTNVLSQLRTEGDALGGAEECVLSATFAGDRAVDQDGRGIERYAVRGRKVTLSVIVIVVDGADAG